MLPLRTWSTRGQIPNLLGSRLFIGIPVFSVPSTPHSHLPNVVLIMTLHLPKVRGRFFPERFCTTTHVRSASSNLCGYVSHSSSRWFDVVENKDSMEEELPVAILLTTTRPRLSCWTCLDPNWLIWRRNGIAMWFLCPNQRLLKRNCKIFFSKEYHATLDLLYLLLIDMIKY